MHARKVEIEGDNTVETNTAATVGRDTGLSEDIDAVGSVSMWSLTGITSSMDVGYVLLFESRALGVDPLLAHPSLKLFRIVDTLAAGEDLLVAHEEAGESNG